MRVPENIRKCVAYIGYANQINNTFGPVGSVFFIGRDQGNGVADPIYAVTAKHVIDGLRKKGVQETIIRLNMKVGDPALGIARVPIDSWFSHPEDESIDVAIHKMGIWVQIGRFDKRVFLAHRNHRGVDDEKDNEEPWREDRQRHQAGDPQTLFIRREDQDRLGWPAR
ncbi:hypothetical protein [Aliiroseovarius subalbicans]|uniref:hypothetical protein n=1 Tax=Aliiroseovarius subalbicans TaxID=2925840 RepID=UPI001F5A92BA|nr:hypothetical protein [Aliiroseovarius subalbicans]MCI2398188.1 hypothetical protein [Aliiroseovarius subalbicans]